MTQAQSFLPGSFQFPSSLVTFFNPTCLSTPTSLCCCLTSPNSSPSRLSAPSYSSPPPPMVALSVGVRCRVIHVSQMTVAAAKPWLHVALISKTHKHAHTCNRKERDGWLKDKHGVSHFRARPYGLSCPFKESNVALINIPNQFFVFVCLSLWVISPLFFTDTKTKAEVIVLTGLLAQWLPT